MHKNRKARKDTTRYKTTLKFECFCQLNERKNYQYYKPHTPPFLDNAAHNE